MRSAEQNLLKFLRDDYPNWYAAAQLERMEFRNEDGTLASGKSINRRLQELRSEGLLEVEYRNKHHAHYRSVAPKFIYTIPALPDESPRKVVEW